MVTLAGIPMFFLEVSICQFMSSGGIKVWNISPIFTGIGFATTLIVFFLNVYYNVIMSWAFFYLFSSFTAKVPWSHCGNEWNTFRCRSVWGNDATNSSLSNFTSIGANISSSLLSNMSMASLGSGNGTSQQPDYYVDSTTEFWQRRVLDISDGIDNPGKIKWDLALCLLLAWTVVFACISKGVKSSGKVMYVTATAPYVFMLILMIRGCTLKGAGTGIIYYLNPTLDRLGYMQTWVDAGTQIFFSYSIGIGASTALGSFNKFHHNSLKDSVIFACINSGTSFMAGFVIFAVLGYMAEEQGVDIADVAESGPGLAFIAYPKALAAMPIAPLWSVFFFIMVILLGLDSEFVAQEGLVATIVDMFPVFLRKGNRRVFFTGAMCALCYLMGLCMVTQGGMYVFQIFDFYSGSRIILLVAFFECIAVGWVYGVDRFIDNLEMMYGFRIEWLNFMMKWAYLVVTPLTVMIIFVMNCISYSQLTIKFSAHQIYHFPSWAISVGWLLACISIIWVPIYAIYLVLRVVVFRPGDLNLRDLIRPKLLPHQMRPQDDRRDINPDATMENTFLPSDLLARYDGSIHNYKAPEGAPAVAFSAGGPRLPDYSEAVEMETAKLQPV